MIEFAPTYLCIKQHSITELKYLCKTQQSHEGMLKYKGSGKYWKNHLKMHGRKQVETLWYCLFYKKEEIEKFALMCSKQWNIVEAKDKNGKKIWANLMFENGFDGAPIGRSALWVKGGPEGNTYRKGKRNSKESNLRRSLTQKGISKNKGIPKSIESNIKRAATMLGQVRGEQEKITCPFCSIIGGKANMKRYHFDNCKRKNIQCLTR